MRNVDLFYQGLDGPELNTTLSIKKNYTMKAYAREALFFSRRCEIYGNFTRQNAYNQLITMNTRVDQLLQSDFFNLGQTIIGAQILLLLIPALLLCLFYKRNIKYANGTKSPPNLRLFALSLLMHIFFLMITVGFGVYIFLGTDLAEISAT